MKGTKGRKAAPGWGPNAFAEEVGQVCKKPEGSFGFWTKNNTMQMRRVPRAGQAHGPRASVPTSTGGTPSPPRRAETRPLHVLKMQ